MIKTMSSWFSCVSSRCCDTFPQSSSHVQRDNGGLCSARSPSWISLYHQHGTSIQADCNSRIDRNKPLRKRQIFPFLSPFGETGVQQFLTRRVSAVRVNRWCHPVFIYTWSRDHSCAAASWDFEKRKRLCFNEYIMFFFFFYQDMLCLGN